MYETVKCEIMGDVSNGCSLGSVLWESNLQINNMTQSGKKYAILCHMSTYISCLALCSCDVIYLHDAIMT